MSQNQTKLLVQTIFALKRVIFSHLRESNEMTAEKMLQYETLAFIDVQTKPRMKDLARFFGITPPSITCMVKKMEQQKLLIRNHDNKDRRTVFLQITTKGKNILNETGRKLEKEMIRFMRPLNEKDKTEFIKIYTKIFTHYEST